jgi:magnesium transporter
MKAEGGTVTFLRPSAFVLPGGIMAAMTLPWLLVRLGADPAFGSGPLATVIQDLLSIVIYLVICRAIVS